MRKVLGLAAFSLVAMTCAVLSQSTDYPSKPVRVVVPLAVGSGGDTFARFFAEKLSGELGQQFVVENMPGAGGVIGAVAVKRASPDGYTILQGSAAVVSVNPVIVKDLSYDPIHDFKPVFGLVRGMNVIVVPATSSIHNLAELVAVAKNAPAPLNSGTFSPIYQLAQEWFSTVAGIKLNNVPYKGGGALINDVVGGHIDVAVTDLAGTASLIQSGKVRALAVTGEARHPNFPEVPTVRESGYPDYVNYAWASFYVRSDVPDQIVAKLAAAVAKIQATAEAREIASKAGGAELMPFGPEAMRKFQLEEIQRMRWLADIAGIRPQ